jgi:putative transposase
VAAKVTLVRDVHGWAGLSLALRTIGLARATWYYQRHRRPAYAVRYAALQAPLARIARQHPEYGYRRTTTDLEELLGHVVNQKVVRRLHQLWELPLLRQTHVPPPSGVRQVLAHAGARANLVASLAAIAPLQVLYTDFTQLRYAAGTAWLMTLLDHASKVVAGWALGQHADTALALRAWRRARRWLRRHGVPVAGRIVHHDQDPVYTGYGWTGQLLLRDATQLSYTLNGCRDNPEMESFHSRFKAENRSLFLDALTLADLERVVTRRMAYYNGRRRHSSLGNQAPLRFLASFTPQG